MREARMPQDSPTAAEHRPRAITQCASLKFGVEFLRAQVCELPRLFHWSHRNNGLVLTALQTKHLSSPALPSLGSSLQLLRIIDSKCCKLCAVVAEIQQLSYTEQFNALRLRPCSKISSSEQPYFENCYFNSYSWLGVQHVLFTFHLIAVLHWLGCGVPTIKSRCIICQGSLLRWKFIRCE